MFPEIQETCFAQHVELELVQEIKTKPQNKRLRSKVLYMDE